MAGVEGADWGTWASIGTACTAAGSLVTWLWGRAGKSAILAQHVKEAKEAAAAAITRADKMQVSYDKLLDDMRQHMIADAASFAKLEAIAGEASRVSVASELRLTSALENLGNRVDAMAARFDEVLTVIRPTK